MRVDWSSVLFASGCVEIPSISLYPEVRIGEYGGTDGPG